MTKDLEIVDDTGDEFYATNTPIPFYIRLKLDSDKTKYRAKILDESGNTRSFYTGVTNRDFLELHVPVIPLPNKGKIIVEIEVSDIGSEDSTKHRATIDYVSQEEYDSIKKLNATETVEEAKLPTQNEDFIDETEESPELTSEELAYLTQTTDTLNVLKEVEENIEVKELETEVSTQPIELADELERSAELSVDELAYLTQSEVTVEDVIEEVETGEPEPEVSDQPEELADEPKRSAELSVDELAYLTQSEVTVEDVIEEVETGEPEPEPEVSDQLEELADEPKRSAEFSVDELAYLTQSEVTIEDVIKDVKTQEFESRASVQLEEVADEPERSAELSVDEIAYLTQRAEILRESAKEVKETVTEQILSVDSDEEE